MDLFSAEAFRVRPLCATHSQIQLKSLEAWSNTDSSWKQNIPAAAKHDEWALVRYLERMVQGQPIIRDWAWPKSKPKLLQRFLHLLRPELEAPSPQLLQAIQKIISQETEFGSRDWVRLCLKCKVCCLTPTQNIRRAVVFALMAAAHFQSEVRASRTPPEGSEDLLVK